MNKLLFLIFTSFLTTSAFAQSKLPDQSTPRNTLETLFRYARTQELSKIHLLCPPSGNDGDTKELCQLATADRHKQKQFHKYFKLAYSTTEAYKSLGVAQVSFRFGPRAQRTETMNLVLIEGKWYLSSY